MPTPLATRNRHLRGIPSPTPVGCYGSRRLFALTLLVRKGRPASLREPQHKLFMLSSRQRQHPPPALSIGRTAGALAALRAARSAGDKAACFAPAASHPPLVLQKRNRERPHTPRPLTPQPGHFVPHLKRGSITKGSPSLDNGALCLTISVPAPSPSALRLPPTVRFA